MFQSLAKVPADASEAATLLERFAIVMKHNLHVGCSWRIRLA